MTVSPGVHRKLALIVLLLHWYLVFFLTLHELSRKAHDARVRSRQPTSGFALLPR